MNSIFLENKINNTIMENDIVYSIQRNYFNNNVLIESTKVNNIAEKVKAFFIKIKDTIKNFFYKIYLKFNKQARTNLFVELNEINNDISNAEYNARILQNNLMKFSNESERMKDENETFQKEINSIKNFSESVSNGTLEIDDMRVYSERELNSFLNIMLKLYNEYKTIWNKIQTIPMDKNNIEVSNKKLSLIKDEINSFENEIEKCYRNITPPERKKITIREIKSLYAFIRKGISNMDNFYNDIAKTKSILEQSVEKNRSAMKVVNSDENYEREIYKRLKFINEKLTLQLNFTTKSNSIISGYKNLLEYSLPGIREKIEITSRKLSKNIKRLEELKARLNMNKELEKNNKDSINSNKARQNDYDKKLKDLYKKRDNLEKRLNVKKVEK